jgi:hypothetical protein
MERLTSAFANLQSNRKERYTGNELQVINKTGCGEGERFQPCPLGKMTCQVFVNHFTAECLMGSDLCISNLAAPYSVL